MKKLFILLAVIIILSSCSENENQDLIDTVEEVFIETETTTPDSMPDILVTTGPFTFDNMKSFKNSLIENGNLFLDSNELIEVINIPDGYIEQYIEWGGMRDYGIIYANGEYPLAFNIFLDEEDFYSYYTEDIRTYEYFENNYLISNLRREKIETEFGEGEIYTYDTEVYENIKSLYLEFTHNGKKYIVNESYIPPEYEIQSSTIYVIAENNSFVIYSNSELSYKNAIDYELDKVK